MINMRMKRQRQRGAVIVETAIVVPLLIGLLVGALEFGLAWRLNNEMTRTVQTATLAAARSGVDRQADFQLLREIRAGVPDSPNIEWVIVYRTTAGDGEPPVNCVNAAESLVSGSTGFANTCNIYHGSFVATASAADFTLDDCSGEADQWLCPSDRRALLGNSDRIGVALKYEHEWLTGMLPGGGLTFSDKATSPLITGLGEAS